MTYGRSPSASAKDPTAERARSSGSWGRYQAWRQLDPDLRLQLIETALEVANDRIDQFPLAL